jgi:hypothetical protein
VSDSRSPIRRSAKRRGRKVQGTLLGLLSPSDDSVPEEFPALDFKTFPYRTALANWPDEWRERWGHRANALEDEGLDWQEAESRAFFEIQEERRAEQGIRSIPLAPPNVESN